MTICRRFLSKPSRPNQLSCFAKPRANDDLTIFRKTSAILCLFVFSSQPYFYPFFIKSSFKEEKEKKERELRADDWKVNRQVIVKSSSEVMHG